MFLELEPASECSPVSAQHSVMQSYSPLRPAVHAGGQGAVLQRCTGLTH